MGAVNGLRERDLCGQLLSYVGYLQSSKLISARLIVARHEESDHGEAFYFSDREKPTFKFLRSVTSGQDISNGQTSWLLST